MTEPAAAGQLAIEQLAIEQRNSGTRVPANRSPWADPPRTTRRPRSVAPGVVEIPPVNVSAIEIPLVEVPPIEVPPIEVSLVEIPAPESPASSRPAVQPVQPAASKLGPNRPHHLAVVSGTARTGRIVARLLAEQFPSTTISDAGQIVGAPAWSSAIGSADELVLAVDAVGGGPSEAVDLLDQAVRGDRNHTLRRAVTIVLLPPARRGLSRGHEDIAAIREYFERRTRAVLFAPNEPRPTAASELAWAQIVAEIRRGSARERVRR